MPPSESPERPTTREFVSFTLAPLPIAPIETFAFRTMTRSACTEPSATAIGADALDSVSDRSGTVTFEASTYTALCTPSPTVVEPAQRPTSVTLELIEIDGYEPASSATTPPAGVRERASPSVEVTFGPERVWLTTKVAPGGGNRAEQSSTGMHL